ncbi:MAG: HisA/HisF-related TIM barrel protein, partial [Solirubrobacteraceae bacterium]
GVHRFVLSHGGSAPDPAVIQEASAGGAAEVLVAGGVQDLAEVARLKSAGVRGLILGEVLLAGKLDFRAALAAAA